MTALKIVDPEELRGRLGLLWASGMPPGDRTGWPDCDQYYSVAPGMLTIITGWPSSGKSEWLDALALNLALQGWQFAVYSPENLPHEIHLAKLLEKFLHKPFPAGPTERLTIEEMFEGIDELRKSLRFLATPDEDPATMLDIMEAAATVFENSARLKYALIVDPWNDLDHSRPVNFTETEYIGRTLGTIRRWAKLWKAHVFLVAHPQKMQRENGKLPIPRPDMISGSQHWWNRADCCITVHRDMADPHAQEVEIHFQKVKFKHLGKPGVATLRYDRVTGRYYSGVPAGHVRGVK